eukprot:1711331-Karenia_brevis.AAC.1
MCLLSGGIKNDKQCMIPSVQKAPKKTSSVLFDYCSSPGGVTAKKSFIIGKILSIRQLSFDQAGCLASCSQTLHV